MAARGTPHTPGILYECQSKGLIDFAIRNRLILKELEFPVCQENANRRFRKG